MGRTTPRRRDRIRAETSSEIKTIALKHLTAGGAEAVSLRAIAREMGMTASAIYSYFDTRDDLITALIADSYASLAGVMEAAGAGGSDTGAADRILAVATAYRQWAISHPEEFRLIYGDPVAGYQAPEDDAVREAEDRACAVLLRLVETGWPVPEHPAAEPYDWADFGEATPAACASCSPTCHRRRSRWPCGRGAGCTGRWPWRSTATCGRNWSTRPSCSGRRCWT